MTPSQHCLTRKIVVGARQSRLSQAQFWEVSGLLKQHHPEVVLHPYWVVTEGDRDRVTSLRSLDKTDFFTKQIDQLLLQGGCRVAVHSAKDLPEPLPEGLILVALTLGIDPGDVLVLRNKETLDSLRSGAIVATSSKRREEAVRQLRADLCFVDLRGTIEERLSKLESGQADGVVVAEAALIRLGITALNRVRLPGSTAQHQGQLAIVAREGDVEMQRLFECLDSR